LSGERSARRIAAITRGDTILASGEAARRRDLGIGAALALVIGNMVGSGIYLLPATLAPLGANALIAWGVTIAGAMCLAYMFARLAARVPAAGGPYAFADAAFGPAAGFAVAWSYWVLIWSGNGAIAVAVVSALAVIVPELRGGPASALAALALLWLLVAVNVRGVALAGRVQLVTTLLKLVPLLAVIVLAAWLLAGQGGAALADNPAVPVTGGAIGAAAALCFWGFLGVESATVPADKVADAARVVPLVTLVGAALTGLIYMLVATSVALLLPAGEVAQSPAPVADLLGRYLGSAAGEATALFAAISAFGALNGFILLQGEMPRAMAQGGVFPGWLGRESRHGTPARAHYVSGVLATAVMSLNYTGGTGQLFADIVTISLAAGMLAYFTCALAALKLLRGEPAARVAALVAAGFVAWLVWGLGTRADLWGLALLALGLPVYWGTRRGQADRRSP
jgi:APA family basic amino acid/polyamine antiporter